MQLKHIFCAIVGFSLLTACYPFKTDDPDGRAQRIAERRSIAGCGEWDDHEGYRDCVIATANAQTPKTYITAEDSDGRAIAVMKSTKPCEGYCPPANTKTVIQTEVIRTVEVTPTKTTTTVVPVVAQEETIKVVETPKTETIQETEKTWWQDYQENKKPEPASTIKCPCPDPNDPCPQCVDK